MTTPAMVRRPDAESWVWANLRHLPGVTSFAFAATTDPPRWVVAWSVQVDARAPRKQAALATAEDARQVMVRLPFTDWPGGIVCDVAVTEGPFWDPDDDGGPRYTARYEVRVHPRRESIGAAAIGADTGHPGRYGRKTRS